MKKYIFFLILIAILHSVSALNLNAQYKSIKEQYKDQPYTYQPGDKYHPLIIGVATVLLAPGMSHVIAGELARGALFFGASVLGGGMFIYGFALGFSGIEGMGPYALFFGGIATFWTSYIWSLVDIIQVVHVKNLYYRDQNSIGERIELNPYINRSTLTGTRNYGLSLSFRF